MSRKFAIAILAALIMGVVLPFIVMVFIFRLDMNVHETMMVVLCITMVISAELLLLSSWDLSKSIRG